MSKNGVFGHFCSRSVSLMKVRDSPHLPPPLMNSIWASEHSWEVRGLHFEDSLPLFATILPSNTNDVQKMHVFNLAIINPL